MTFEGILFICAYVVSFAQSARAANGTKTSQVITFQVSHEKTKTNGRVFAFFIFLLALELLDDSEVETNDLLGEDNDITFKSSPRLL